MNDRRIVERLREWPLSEKLALEAADRIEALEAALREVEAIGKYWQNKAIKAEGIPAAIAEGQTKQ